MTDRPIDDDELERRVRDAVHDPVPGELLRVSSELFTWRTVDAELAELVLADAGATAGVRGTLTHIDTFIVGDRVIVVEQDDRGEVSVDLGGRWADAVAIYTPAGEAMRADTDEAGVARFRALPRGPVQFVIDTVDAAIKLRWITL
jgi:hypothetical protein